MVKIDSTSTVNGSSIPNNLRKCNLSAFSTAWTGEQILAGGFTIAGAGGAHVSAATTAIVQDLLDAYPNLAVNDSVDFIIDNTLAVVGTITAADASLTINGTAAIAASACAFCRLVVTTLTTAAGGRTVSTAAATLYIIQGA